MSSEEQEKVYHLFEAAGVELEYMIVRDENLNIFPMADTLLKEAAQLPGAVAENADDENSEWPNSVDFGPVGWSNELALHVIEIKTLAPSKDLVQSCIELQSQVSEIHKLLKPYKAKLLPGGAHPWMNPAKEVRLWPHGQNAIYEAYDRIFNCAGHGWVNLQSTHLNLPFGNDDEFGRLHAAIRLLLPILPALAASTPILDGQSTGILDTRLHFYQNNQKKIPELAGKVIPEAVFSHHDYQKKIFDKMYTAIAPHDPGNILQDEWLNSRGAIPRWDRDAIEIRIIDNQECPAADLAICFLAIEVLKALVSERWLSYAEQQYYTENDLSLDFWYCIRQGSQAKLENSEYLEAFGIHQSSPMLACELWKHLFKELCSDGQCPPIFKKPLELILSEGTLAERILKAVGPEKNPSQLEKVYGRLSECLSQGTSFIP